MESSDRVRSCVGGCFSLGCLSVVLFVVVGTVLSVGNKKPDPPPFDHDETVNVSAPERTNKYSEIGDTPEMPDGVSEMTWEAVKDVHERASQLLYAPPAEVDVQCEEIKLENGRYPCVVKYKKLEMEYEVFISEISRSETRIPPGETETLVDYERMVRVKDKIMFYQEMLNWNFWEEHGYGEKGYKLRCDQIPKPLLAGKDKLGKFKCYVKNEEDGGEWQTEKLKFVHQSTGSYLTFRREE